jgi:hypothetical protein
MSTQDAGSFGGIAGSISGGSDGWLSGLTNLFNTIAVDVKSVWSAVNAPSAPVPGAGTPGAGTTGSSTTSAGIFGGGNSSLIMLALLGALLYLIAKRR